MLALTLAFLMGAVLASFGQRWVLGLGALVWGLVTVAALVVPHWYAANLGAKPDELVNLAGLMAGFMAAETTRRLVFD